MQIITAFGRTLVSEGSETMKNIVNRVTSNPRQPQSNHQAVPTKNLFENRETVKHKSMESTTWRNTPHRFTVF